MKKSYFKKAGQEDVLTSMSMPKVDLTKTKSVIISQAEPEVPKLK